HAHLPVKTPIQVGRRSLYHSVRFFARGTVLTHDVSNRAPRTSSVIVNELPVLLAGDILVCHMPEPVRVRAADRHTGFKVVGQPTKFVPLHVSHLAQLVILERLIELVVTDRQANTPRFPQGPEVDQPDNLARDSIEVIRATHITALVPKFDRARDEPPHSLFSRIKYSHVSHLAQNSTVTSGRKQALTQSRENTPPLYRLKYTPP